MSDYLKSAFLRGIILGPDETLESFEKRVRLPQKTSHALYHFQVDWVSIYYKDRGLRGWEGACTWIGERQAVLQLRKVYKDKKYLWGIYPKEELLQHELVHAVRLKYNEPQFEEVLAYRTSKSRLRRFLGPFFQTTRETLLFVLLASLAPLPYLSIVTFPLFIITTLGALVRLIHKQTVLAKGMKNLSLLLIDSSQVEGFMLHLTDREIRRFQTLEKVRPYVESQKDLRWQQIKSCYAFKDL